MKLFGILTLTIVFLAIVILRHSNSIKIIDATPEKIANKVKFMLIQGKTKFVIKHDYKGNQTINKHYDTIFQRQDIMNTIYTICPEYYININFVNNKVIIKVNES